MNFDPKFQPLKVSDLQYIYPPGAVSGDDPKLRGHPDRDLLNRNESYEMLYFCNKFAIDHSQNKDIASLTSVAKKTEKLVKEKVPENVHGRKNITDWLIRNWNMFPN